MGTTSRFEVLVDFVVFAVAFLALDVAIEIAPGLFRRQRDRGGAS